MTSPPRQHWDSVYDRLGATGVSWYEREPLTSVSLIEELDRSPDAAVIDVGGGASTLVDTLLARGHTDLTVLDVSQAALDVSRRRLGADADRVHWVCTDLLDWQPERRYDVWHDRAVFHFLVDPADRRRYRALLHEGVAPDGRVVIGTFAADGPQQCSGLPTARYDPIELAATLDVVLDSTRREGHVTPAGVVQPFTWIVGRLSP